MAGRCRQSKQPRHGRPPHPLGAYIPEWEKRFITERCKIPWQRACEAKKLMYWYKNVMQWDDSGAREDLENAKSRYWLEINGLPCDIPLPDPDRFIDEIIDYDAAIDPELIAELEKRPPEPVIEDEDFDSFSIPLEMIVPTGWGDEEDAAAPPPDPTKDTVEYCGIAYWINFGNTTPVVPTGGGDAEDPYPSAGDHSNDAWNFCYNAGWDNWLANNNTWRRNGRRRHGGRHSGFKSTRPRYLQDEDDYPTSAGYCGEDPDSYSKLVYSRRPIAFN